MVITRTAFQTILRRLCFFLSILWFSFLGAARKRSNYYKFSEQEKND